MQTEKKAFVAIIFIKYKEAFLPPNNGEYIGFYVPIIYFDKI